MKEGVKIYGGFAGDENPATFNLNNRDFTVNKTILSGDIGTEGNSSDNCYHVFYHPNSLALSSATLLNGVTITDGNADGNIPHNSGGGMYNNNSSPLLTNVIICNNSAITSGGGIYNDGASPVFSNMIINSNATTDNGGGIYNTNASSQR